MERKSGKTLFLFLLITLTVGLGAGAALAGNIEPNSFAWGENVGWINFAPSQGPGVTVTGTAVTGFAWGENIGWINLSPTNGGVINDGAGNLTGFAWGENVGWISFSCQNTGTCATASYGVTIGPTTGLFSGFAWGENVGWINFAPTGGGVTTSWRQPFTLTVNRVGTGSGTVTSSPAGINCGKDCSEPYNPGTIVTLTATAAAGSFFAGWSGGTCTGAGLCMLTVNADTAVTATFDPQPAGTFALTVAKAGSGDGTVTGTGINCGTDCTEAYTSGTSVTLTATPASGSFFAGWSGGCSGTGTCTVTMTANASVTAKFSKTFTDDPLTAQVTLVKAVHINDLRQAIGTLRSQRALTTFAYTDPTLIAGVTEVRAAHITELRTALNGVYTALGRALPTYTDPTITAGVTVIKSAHIAEIRSAVRAAE